MGTLPMLWTAVAIVAAAVLSYYDIRTFNGRYGRLPNWVTLPFLCFSLILWSLWRGWPGMWETWAGALLAAIIAILPKGGAGDAKLAAAFGTALGLGGMPIFAASYYSLVWLAIVMTRCWQGWQQGVGPLRLIWLDIMKTVPPVRLPGAPFIAGAGLLAVWVVLIALS